ncbi:cytochrome P450 2K4-like protein, partial [Leptotrombidium deliense]
MFVESGLGLTAAGKSFAISEGVEWKVQSRFLIGHLSNLGMGKPEFELTMHDLLDDVEQYIQETNGTPHDFQRIISNYMFNTMTSIVASKRYDVNSDYFTLAQKLSAKIFDGLSGLNFILYGDLFLYWLKLKGTDLNMVKNIFEEMSDLAQQLINERLEIFDTNNCQDLLDYLIKESSGANAEYFQCRCFPY